MAKREHYFYDQPIHPNREQQYIQELLFKYRHFPPTLELKKQIWDELQREKQLGNITIPFKVILKKDANGKYPDFIEIILDTKV